MGRDIARVVIYFTNGTNIEYFPKSIDYSWGGVDLQLTFKDGNYVRFNLSNVAGHEVTYHG
jgi:hypothetical protein